MVKIGLFCAAGFSTGMLVNNMKIAAQSSGVEAEIEAFSQSKLADYAPNLDVALLGPQVAYTLDKSKEICNGGNPLWNPKYQLGASFIGDNRIVLGREENGFDKIEIYNYDKEKIRLDKEIYFELIGNTFIRNARPIVDINQKVFLWHRGFYNPNVYTDFFTEAKIYDLQ